MNTQYVVTLYPKHSRLGADCLPCFFDTRSEAIAAAQEEIARVNAIPEAMRYPTVDWAVRFTVRKVRI